jgi:hypothetical protein
MDISAIALQGLQQADSQLESAAAKIASFGASSSDGGGVDVVDLSAAVIALLTAKNQALVNIGTLKTAAEIQKTLLDVRA